MCCRRSLTLDASANNSSKQLHVQMLEKFHQVAKLMNLAGIRQSMTTTKTERLAREFMVKLPREQNRHDKFTFTDQATKQDQRAKRKSLLVPVFRDGCSPRVKLFQGSSTSTPEPKDISSSARVKTCSSSTLAATRQRKEDGFMRKRCLGRKKLAG